MNTRRAKKKRKRLMKPFKGLLRKAQQSNLIAGVAVIRTFTGPSPEK